ncbi:hypothetical protein BDZ91DRAFT_751945 [Kalaharituber pfeilii]|nr:hypothetical protein BDZ91DRAFT_751945 [Kalaharituber pfeilii]
MASPQSGSSMSPFPAPTARHPSPASCPLSALPLELLLRIFTFLGDRQSLISAALTCRSFHDQIFDTTADKYIWKAAAREACGFGGNGLGVDLADLDNADTRANFSLHEQWAIMDRHAASLKGKEREIQGDLCQAQMKWERFFRIAVPKTSPPALVIPSFIAPAPVPTPLSRPSPDQPKSPPPETHVQSRRSARIAAKKAANNSTHATAGAAPREVGESTSTKPSLPATAKPSQPATTKPSFKRKIAEIPAPPPAKKPKLPRYNKASTSLPPLSTPPSTDTHHTKRILGDWGPPVVSVKMPTCMKMVMNGEKEDESTRQKWEREMARGGVAEGAAFLVFADDPRMVFGERDTLDDDVKYTMRRAVIGGHFGQQPPLPSSVKDGSTTEEKNKQVTPTVGKDALEDSTKEGKEGVDIKTEDDGKADSGNTSRVQSDTATMTLRRDQIRQLSEHLSKITLRSVQARSGLEELPENDEPWMNQGKSYSTITGGFIRPTSNASLFPSQKRYDKSQDLRASILEHFPSMRKMIGEEPPKGGTNLAEPMPSLDFYRLQKMGITNDSLQRWLKNTIHSDANLKLIPQLRKRDSKDTSRRSRSREQASEAGIEVSAVERLTVDMDSDFDSTSLKTKVNMRWELPKSEKLLSLCAKWELPTTITPQLGSASVHPPTSENNDTSNPTTTIPSTIAANSSAAAQAGASSSAAGPSTAATGAAHLHLFSSTLGVPISSLAAHPLWAGISDQPNLMWPDIAHFAYQTWNDSTTTWEFRSRGKNLIVCDDNDGYKPSTISCFRPGVCKDPDLGDLVWQRFMVVPLHYRETRHTTAAAIMNMEQSENLAHEYYYLDNDGLQLTSSMAIYCTRRHIISSPLLGSHRLDLTRQLASDISAQSKLPPEKRQSRKSNRGTVNAKVNRDKWGIGTSTGYKAACEFWMLSLENGHTVKIVSLKEEIREVSSTQRGGGIVAFVGGAKDSRNKYKSVMRKVEMLHERSKFSREQEVRMGRKGKGKGKAKGKDKSAKKKKWYYRDEQEEDEDYEDYEDWTTTSSYENALDPRCHCPACSYTTSDEYDSDASSDYMSAQERFEERRRSSETRYGHRFLFCWDFKAHPIDSDDLFLTEQDRDSDFEQLDRLKLLPLPSQSWYKYSDVYLSLSPCSRFIVISSDYRFGVWDLESPEPKLELWKVPNGDIERWTRGGLFDRWHDREYYPTVAENQDDMECQPFNGAWIMWEDVAYPKDPDPTVEPVKLNKGVTFINSIDLRKYVDGIDIVRDTEERMEDYRIVLDHLVEEREWEMTEEDGEEEEEWDEEDDPEADEIDEDDYLDDEMDLDMDMGVGGLFGYGYGAWGGWMNDYGDNDEDEEEDDGGDEVGTNAWGDGGDGLHGTDAWDDGLGVWDLNDGGGSGSGKAEGDADVDNEIVM